MPKLKLTGRKLCTTGRKLAVCGCSPTLDPCCTSVSGALAYVPAVGGLRRWNAAASMTASQTTTGWSNTQFPHAVYPAFTANGQWTSANANDNAVPQTQCVVSTEVRNGMEYNAGAWNPYNVSGTTSGSVDTPSGAIVVGQNASVVGQILYDVRPAPEFTMPSGSYYIPRAPVANVGFDPTKTVLHFAAFVSMYSYAQISPTSVTNEAANWHVVVRMSANGGYVVRVQAGDGFNNISNVTAQSVTVTPTLSGSYPVGLSINGSFRAVRPVRGNVPSVTDTLSLQASYQTNVLACAAQGGSVLDSLDDAIFS